MASDPVYPEFFAERQATLEAQSLEERLNTIQAQPAHQRRLRWLSLIGALILLALATIYHYAIYLPQPDVPHRLTLLDDVFALGVVGLVGMVGLILGRRLLRYFPLAAFSRLEQNALALGLGWGVVSLAVLALGLAHLLYAWLLMVGLGLMLVIFWRDAWGILGALTSGASYQRLRALVPRGFFLWALVVIVLLEGALLGMQSLILPFEPQGWDVYAYHWAVPRLYLLQHAIYALPGWAHANFPFGTEMLNTLALAFNSQVAAVLLQETFGLLAVLLLMGYLYRHWGVVTMWVGAALCFSSILFTTILVSGYAESGVTYYGMASVVLVMAWLEQSARTAAPGNRRLLFLAGLLMGCGLAAKYTEGQVVAGVLLLFAGVGAASVLRARRQEAPSLPVLRRFLVAVLVYTMSLALPVLPWLLKDWALLDNPIYPFVWGGPGWDTARTQTGVITLAHFGPHGPLWQRPPGALFDLFFASLRVADTPFATPPNSFLLAALALPVALLIGWIGQRRQWLVGDSQEDQRAWLGMLWLVVAGGGWLAWALSGAAVARYALPWVLLLAVPAALVLAAPFQARWRWPLAQLFTQNMRATLLYVLLLFVAVGGPVLSAPFWLAYSPLSLLTGTVSLHQWEEQHLFDPGYWAMVKYVNTDVPRQGKLLLLGRGTGYFLEGRDYIADSGEDWIPYLETEGHTPAGILALLRQDNFRYVVYEETTLTYVIQAYENNYIASFLPAFRQFLAGSLIQVWSYQNFYLYRVPPP